MILAALQALSLCSSREGALSEVKRGDYGGEKRGSEKEEKLLSSAITTVSRPGSGELSKLKPNWKKAQRVESSDPPVWREILHQGSYGSVEKYDPFGLDYITLSQSRKCCTCCGTSRKLQ